MTTHFSSFFHHYHQSFIIMSDTPHKGYINVDTKEEDTNAPTSRDASSVGSGTIDNGLSTCIDPILITLPSNDDLPDDDNKSSFMDKGCGNASVTVAEDEQGSDVARLARYDRYEDEARREIEKWEAKRKEPIQIHLEALHQAYRNVDPEYTVFAFGGTIPPEEIDAGNLTLHVASWGSLGEENTRFDGQMRKQGNVVKRRKRACRGNKE
jgi:hypothetical protein